MSNFSFEFLENGVTDTQTTVCENVKHTCPVSSVGPCHATDTRGSVFGRLMVLGWWWWWWWRRVLLFLPPFTPSLCPPDGCWVECSVTRLFLEEATWNTATGASMRINTSCFRAVWHVKHWVWLDRESASAFFTAGRETSCSRLLVSPSASQKLSYWLSGVWRPSTLFLNLLKVPEALEMSPEDRGAGLRYDCVFWRRNLRRLSERISFLYSRWFVEPEDSCGFICPS